ncbi:hypothetical protein TWF281_006280 [Arthrobotrys megalospora]
MKFLAPSLSGLLGLSFGFLAILSQIPQISAQGKITTTFALWDSYITNNWDTLVEIGENTDMLHFNREAVCPIGGPEDTMMKPSGKYMSLWYYMDAFKLLLKNFDEARWALRQKMKENCPHLVPELYSGAAQQGLPIEILTEEERNMANYPEAAGQINAEQQGAADEDWEDIDEEAGYENWPWIQEALGKWGCKDLEEVEGVSSMLSTVIAQTEVARKHMLRFGAQLAGLSGGELGEGSSDQNIQKLARQIDGAVVNARAQTVTYSSYARPRLVGLLRLASSTLSKDLASLDTLEADLKTVLSGTAWYELAKWGLPSTSNGTKDKMLGLVDRLGVWYRCWTEQMDEMADTISNKLDPAPGSN